MGRRRPRSITKAQTPTVAATFTPDQVTALLAAKSGIVVQGQPLPRNETQPPFGPGIPLVPVAINPPRPDTGRPEPRAFEYQTSFNQPGFGDRLVPWKVLRDAADGVSIFRRCIEIRKAEVATLEWDITLSERAVERALITSGGTARADLQLDMQRKLQPWIAKAVAFMEQPDKRNGLDFIGWAKKLIEERLVTDAAAIYPRRTFGGDLYSLEILDGTTIKCLLAEDGGRPLPPQPAYQQVLYGFPRSEFVADVDADGNIPGAYTADQLIYERDNVRSWTPYGYSAVERALNDGLLYVQRNQWMLAEYTDGVMPSGWLVAGAEQGAWTPQQLAEYERVLNDYYGGITAQRQRLRILPPGMTPHESSSIPEKYKPEYDLHLLKLCSGHFDVTSAELGFTEHGGLGSSGYHKGQAEVQDRKATQPTIAWLQSFVTRLLRTQLGMPSELVFNILGQEAEDASSADAIADKRVQGGRTTLNEERDRQGQSRYAFKEADMPFIVTGTGITFIEGSSEKPPAAGPDGQPLPDGNGPQGAPDGKPDDGTQGGPDNGGGPDDKPDDAPKGGGGLNKADELDDADLIKAELSAFARWSRKNPNSRRPFQVQYASPDDFPDVDPTRLEFDEWVWEPDGLEKAWDSAVHPRDPSGRFRKRTLGEVAEHLRGKHGDDRSVWPARSRRRMETMEAEHAGAPDFTYRPTKLSAPQDAALRTGLRDNGMVEGSPAALDALEARGFIDRSKGTPRLTPLGRKQLDATEPARRSDTDVILGFDMSRPEPTLGDTRPEAIAAHEARGAARRKARDEQLRARGAATPAGDTSIAAQRAQDAVDSRPAGQHPLAEVLRTAPTRDAGHAAIAHLDRSGLVALADSLGVAYHSRATKPQLQNAIVRQSVGGRLSTDAVLHSRTDRPVPGSHLAKAEGDADPKAPADQRWPGWTVDEQIAEAYAPVILAALAAGLTTSAALALANAWLDVAAEGAASAAAFLTTQDLDIAGPLADALDDLYIEAVFAGTRSAEAVLDHGMPQLAEEILGGWDNWTPGDLEAARQLLSANGKEVRLQHLLDRFGITIRSIAQHRLDELAAVLADGLEQGRTPDEIARAIRALVTDKAKAYRIAVTETNRAMSAAAVAEYEASGVRGKGWLNSADQDVCAICRENEDVGPIPIGDLFPSKDPFPPAHPHCRCAVVPEDLDDETPPEPEQEPGDSHRRTSPGAATATTGNEPGDNEDEAEQRRAIRIGE